MVSPCLVIKKKLAKFELQVYGVGWTTEMIMMMISKVPTHATKAYRGNEGTAPLILNLDTR